MWCVTVSVSTPGTLNSCSWRWWTTHSIYLLYFPNIMRVIEFLKDKKNRERSSNKKNRFQQFLEDAKQMEVWSLFY